MKRIIMIFLCATFLLCLGGCKEEELLSFSFADYEFPEMDSVVVWNYVSGKKYTITEPEEIEKILAFLRTVEGFEGISAQGFYGGATYQVAFHKGKNRIEFVTFLGEDEFDFGDFGDGYPVKYQTSTPSSREVVDFFCQYDEEYESEDWLDEYLYYTPK